MEKNPNIVSAMLACKCPSCRKGNLFNVSNPYLLKTLYSMPTRCTVCGQHFSPEQGFYWGAMFASYAITVGVTFTIFAVLYFLFDWQIWKIILLDLLVLIAMTPLTARYARVIWIYILVRYKGLNSQA